MRVRVTKDTVKIVDDNYVVNKGEYNINKCEFEFTEEYTEDLIKKAIFVNGETKKEMAIINNECDIPQEVLNSNSFELRVYAYEVSEGELVLRYSPTYTYAYLREGSYMGGATPSEKITPSQFQQYEQALHEGLQNVNDELDLVEEKLQEAENLNIEGQKEGHTATITITDRYGTQTAINVYDGEKGDAGEPGPKGEQGVPGTPGEKGEAGYYFTPAVSANGDLSWTNNGDLENPTTVNIKGPKGDVGPKGDTGVQGPQGLQGPKGDIGATGPQGPAGQDGVTPIKGVDYFTPADIAEIEDDIKEITGNLSNLSTTDKTTLVNAINEIDSSMAVVISDDFTILDSESTAQEIYTAFGGKSELESIVTKLLDGTPLYVKTVVQSEETEDVETSYYSPCYYNCSMADPSPTYDIQFAMIDGTFNNNTLTITLDGEGSTTITDASFDSSNDTYPTLSEVEEITGDLSQLNTTTKTDLVSAINEVASSSGGGIDITPLQTRSIDFANFKKGIYAFGSNSIMYSSITANCSTFATAQGNMRVYYCNGIIVVLKDITSDLQNGEPIIMMAGMGNGRQTITILSVDRTSTTGLSERKIYDDELMLLAGLQTVSGKKIFSVLPETSIVPTTDNQLTNKKYVDDAVAGAGGGGEQIPTLVLDNPYTFVSGGSVTDTTMLSFFSTRITEMLTETPKKGLILIEYNNSGKSELWCCTENVSSQSTQYNFYLVNTEVKSANYRYALAVRGAWANDIFTCSYIMTVQDSYSFVLSNQVLTKTNNDSYTPTRNYHPATKKYVDDAITAAITTTLGGSY